MTIAEINAERGFGQTIENPEDDASSSSSDEDEKIKCPKLDVKTQTQEELEFYKSLMIKPTRANDLDSNNCGNDPPSPLVKTMMALDGAESDDDDDEMNDERWLAIDQSGNYMKEYEKELRRALQEGVGFE